MLLPYIEQSNVYALYNSSLSPFNPANAAAVATIIPGFMCPSVPRSNSTYTNTIPAGTVLAAGYPGTNPALTMTGGVLDYDTLDGVRSTFATVAYTGQPAPGDRAGWGTWSLVISDVPSLSSGGSGGNLRDITDGTSNTILVGETCSRTALYRKGKLIPTSDPFAAAQAMTGSGTWADIFKGVAVRLHAALGLTVHVPSTAPMLARPDSTPGTPAEQRSPLQMVLPGLSVKTSPRTRWHL
jgi:hypothetical protein